MYLLNKIVWFFCNPLTLFLTCAVVGLVLAARRRKIGMWIAGAGIDVYDREPPLDASELLLEAPHTLLTPHTAFATEESMEMRLHIVFDNLRAYLAGKPVNLV
jgi:phosphoglycerate dehydrogenase-like enzyme